MEDKKKKDDVIDELKKKIKESILSKGNNPNPMSVGRGRQTANFSYAIQPHNYRRYYQFDATTLSEQTLLKNIAKAGIVGFNFSKKNYGTELHLDGFWGCRVIIRKNTVEVINKWFAKKWQLIYGDTIEEIDKKIDYCIEDLNNKSDTAVKKLIEYGGGKCDLKAIKSRGEIGIHGDDFLDSIPEDMIIHDTYFKKTYKRKSEFFLDKKGKAGYVKNYITNRALEDIAPQISNELKDMKGVFIEVKKVMELEIKNKKLHQSVLNHMKTTLKDISTTLKKKPYQKEEIKPLIRKITHYKHKLIKSITFCGRYIPIEDNTPLGTVLNITKNINQVDCKNCIKKLETSKRRN